MRNWLPSLNALRAFEAVSRHLNYRKAAEELNVPPGTADVGIRFGVKDHGHLEHDRY